jgi:hypothetical protein
MSLTTRPNTHAEREACLTAAAAMAAQELPALAAAVVAAFCPTGERYAAARARHRVRSSARAEARGGRAPRVCR